VAAEVEEEADSQSGCFQVVEELGLFLSGEMVDRLDFDDYPFAADEVGKVFPGQGLPFVIDVERLFGFKGNCAGCQFEGGWPIFLRWHGRVALALFLRVQECSFLSPVVVKRAADSFLFQLPYDLRR